MWSDPKYWKHAGQRLRIVRLALGISEQEAAEAGGVTVQTYRRGFVRRYDVSLDWLVRGKGEALGRHLSKNAGGKIAILPVSRPERRQSLARQGHA
jgi:transcriptional regulator with XRE-family HTH domain